jgi:hypothetical protein
MVYNVKEVLPHSTALRLSGRNSVTDPTRLGPTVLAPGGPWGGAVLNGKGTQSAREQTCDTATLCTTNTTWNPGVRKEKPLINRTNHHFNFHTFYLTMEV